MFYSLNNVNLSEILINITTSISNSGISFTKSIDNTIIYILLCIMGGSLISNSSGIKFSNSIIAAIAVLKENLDS